MIKRRTCRLEWLIRDVYLGAEVLGLLGGLLLLEGVLGVGATGDGRDLDGLESTDGGDGGSAEHDGDVWLNERD